MGPYSVGAKQSMALTRPGPDGPDRDQLVTLEADVYVPEGEGPFPVLLMRQPYGRAIASTVVYAHPIWYASHGYIVVIQDVRGRGTSTGEFELFRHEAEDGYATVLWAANLPHSSGVVGMYGFSYQGMTQLYAASRQPPPLKTIVPAMVGYDLYADWAYENGALLLQGGLGWALQLAAETARRRGEATAFHHLFQAAHRLPLADPIPANPQILRDLAPDSFFHEWLRHPQNDAYWQSLRPDLEGVDLPMLHLGGWYDPYLRGSLRLYQQMVRQSSAIQHLWVGPWGHLPWGRRVGSRDFGVAAENPIDHLQIQWFDYFLKGRRQADLGQEPPVKLFEMGHNGWRRFDRWPEADRQSLYLGSSGLAGMRQDDGQLLTAPPNSPGQDVIVHDPWRPVPSLGGHSGLPCGCFDRSEIEGRSDVLTYTTPPLQEPLPVVGGIQLEVFCQADTPSFDLSAVVSELDTDGRVMNLTQGYLTVKPEVVGSGQEHHLGLQPIRFTLQPTCFVLPPGHALRLSLAAAAFPAYPVNSGTGKPVGEVQQIEYQIITLRIGHGLPWASRVLLPIHNRVD
ncbi:MAG TPA: CocE/NonD family hydrolase [Leptolyngbyaceae cyanobacterium M65_K2018_010]|nr:CocE/NonD family hydrolase [Leptolyngbyaceae cyanobacterium M65_K2018_010]